MIPIYSLELRLKSRVGGIAGASSTLHSGEEDAVISALQFSELFTPFERAKDYKAKAAVKSEIKKLKLKVRMVDAEIAERS